MKPIWNDLHDDLEAFHGVIQCIDALFVIGSTLPPVKRFLQKIQEYFHLDGIAMFTVIQNDHYHFTVHNDEFTHV